MHNGINMDLCCDRNTLAKACGIFGIITLGLLTVGGSTAIFIYAESLTVVEDAWFARLLGGCTIAGGVMAGIFYAVVYAMAQNNKEYLKSLQP